MKNLLEISGDDIAALDDSNLRELVGLLCEADCKKHGLSPSGVTWGGHQDAKDGGLDVVVENETVVSGSFIPKRKNGFQVKKPDMSASAIIAEMKPNGTLRDSIKSLIEANGSYIIVCSTGSTAEKALQDRRKAMKQAVMDEKYHENIYLDFYDRGRIATWVRTHPSIILWVRNRLGRNLKGWQPYENWTQIGEIQGEFLIDEGVRLFDGTTKSKSNEISIEKGLNKIRTILSSPGSCVRLAGLSGVGKTRFVQALFDEKIGKNTLNSFLVFYTDMSNGPDPDPRTFAEQLIAQRTRAVLVVDNCPPELHRRLTEVCSGSKSSLSLITVEYDVREDLPEETMVFRLEPATDELISKLIKKRFKHIGDVEASKIANFSGGNARIAIALANTVQQGETLSGFRNEDLFDRLFRQRNEDDPSLKKSAEVLSLVYSFEGTEIHSSSELSILASLAGKSANDLYRDVAELKNRDLIQSRSVWRALLPHAIANRLAKNALRTIPRKTLVSVFIEGGSERLLKSFTRRLNFLHDSDDAVLIVSDWLEEDGWLSSLGNLNELGISVLENIAPVSPEKVLQAIERAVKNTNFASRSNSYYSRFVRLLRSIAYESEFFIRSARILCLFALSEQADERNNSTRDVLKSLFYMMLSGTHSPVDVRYSIINELLASTDTKKQDLGLLLLDASLEAWRFSSMYGFDFGARPRDYGYTPKTSEDVTNWYGFLIDKCVEIILLNKHLSGKVKKVLADNFRGLWTKGGMHKELQEASLKIIGTGPWIDGWIEVRTTMHFDKGESVDNNLVRLSELLQPSNLVEQIKTYALSKRGVYFEFIEDEDSPSARMQRADEISFNLALQLAQDNKSLDILIPDLVSKEGTRLWTIGRGLAKGCHDKKTFWRKIRDQIEVTEEGKRNVTILLGFINEISRTDLDLSNKLLDEVLVDSILAKWFLPFQTSVEIDLKGVARLHKALDANVAPISSYKYLCIGRVHQTINDDELGKLLKEILSKEGGDDVALDILHMRFHGIDEKEHTGSIKAAGRQILVSYRYAKTNDIRNMDHNLSRVAETCLVGESAVTSTVLICQGILSAIASYNLSASDCDEYLNVISKNQPLVFLDVIVGASSLEDYQLSSLFYNDFSANKNPLNNISDTIIISWCEADAASRYEKIINLIESFSYNQNISQLEWKSITTTILEKASNTERILNALTDAIRPSFWTNSLADILQQRLILFENFFNHANAEVSAWAKRVHIDLETSIIQEREREADRNRQQNESFE